MDLGVLEGQTRGDYFLNSIFEPSVKQCSEHVAQRVHHRVVAAGAVAVPRQQTDHDLALDRQWVVVVGNQVQPLVAGVLQTGDGAAQQTDTSEEGGARLLVDLLVVPDADRDCVRLADVEVVVLVPLGVQGVAAAVGGVGLASSVNTYLHKGIG